MSEDAIQITVGDLKQWAYCPRVVYYHKLMPGCGVATRKMKAGNDAQEWIEALEVRRVLSRYGFENGQCHRNLSLSYRLLDFAGKIDYLVEDGERAAIIDYKLTASDPAPNHRLQLAAYAYLVEKVYGWKVPVCFLYRIPDAKIFTFPLQENDFLAVKYALEEIRVILADQSLPAATALRSRCTDCEYANFCADTW
jgi:CRISPR-associated exonuclease Cas4